MIDLPTSILVFLLLYLLSAVVTFVLAVSLVIRGEDDKTLEALGVLLVAIVLWSAAEAAQLVTPDIGNKLVWHWIGYVGVVAVPAAFLVFVLYYTGRSRTVKLPTIALLAVEPIITLAMVLTNGSHELYYETVRTASVGSATVLTTVAAPGFWVHIAYSYVVIGLGVFLLVRFALAAERLYRFQTVMLVSGSLVPLIANISFIFGFSSNPALDVTPPTFALSALLIFVAVLYGEFGHFLPVTRDAVLNTLADGVLILDDADRVLYINAAAKQIIGETSPSGDLGGLIGTPIAEIFPLVPAVEELVAPEVPGNGFEASVRRGGESRWFWLRRRDLEDARTGSTLLTVTDITERKARQRKATRLRRLTRELIAADSEAEIAAETIQTSSSAFSLPISAVFMMNDDPARLDPVAVADGVGDDVVDSYARTGGDQAASFLWSVLAEGESRVSEDVGGKEIPANCALPVESAIIHPLGDHGVLLVGAREPRSFDQTDLALLDIMASTVTVALDQVAQEQAIRANQRRLRQQNRRLEEFTSVVSHDLRSPLNTATGYITLLQEDIEDPRLDRIAEATARTKALIDDLLTLARQGRTVDDPARTSLVAVVEAAWESVRAPGITLTVVDDLGEVPADESRLQQAFENLFRNAADHGEKATTLRVGCLADGLFVADDGTGISADERDMVFEHGYSTGEEGTGLGLAIVKRIVEAHGWSVAVTESENGGARFEVTDITDLSPTGGARSDTNSD